MNRQRGALVVAAALVAALPACAAEPDAATLRLFYASGLGHLSVSLDLLGAIEKTLRGEKARGRFVGTESGKAYQSAGEFLFELGTAAAKGAPPDPALGVDAGETEAIETAKELLLATSPEGLPVVEEIWRRATDSSDWERSAPGSRRVRVKLRRFPDGSLAARLPDGRPAARWTTTAMLRYRVEWDGKPVDLRVVGRVLGGPGVVAALRDRLERAPGPQLRLTTGGLHFPPHLGVPRDLSLEVVKDLGFTVAAFGHAEFAFEWELLTSSAASGLSLLCSNLDYTGSGPWPLERIRLEEFPGVKVGLISLLSPAFARQTVERAGLPFKVQDPIEAARAAVGELKKRSADVVVVVSHLSGEEDARLLQLVSGIDILLGDSARAVGSRRVTTVDLEGWSRGRRSAPALRGQRPAHSWSEVALTLRARELVRVEELSGPETAEPAGDSPADAFSRVLERYLVAGEAVLPDPKLLWEERKVKFEPSEFWNAAAAALRRRAGTEVALLPISSLGSNVPGEVQENFVREWLYPDQQPVSARLSGRALAALLRRLDQPGRPVEEDELPKRYWAEPWLAASGLDASGRVSGIGLEPGEVYTVATTAELLRRADDFPELRTAVEARPLEASLAELVLGELKAARRGARVSPAAAARYEGWLRDSAEGRTPVGLVWRINLREFALQFANTKVENAQPFSQVKDARIQSVDQVLTQGSARLFSELSWGRLRWDVGATGEYGRITLQPRGLPEIVNETQDQLVLETELRHKTWRPPGQGGLGPFANVAYDTEFTRPDLIPKRQLVRYRLGLKLSEGARLKEASLGPAAETDNSAAPARTHGGWAASLALEAPVGTSLARLEGSYLELFPTRHDSLQDLRRRLRARASLAVPLVGNLTLNPFVDFYLIEGLAFRSTGRNLLFGLSLAYSRLWKPFY